LITDCDAKSARRKANEGWFDMSTLKEPYRVEGKRRSLRIGGATELAIAGCNSLSSRRRHWSHRMWKAFDEMERLAWIGKKRPRMFAVQATVAHRLCARFEAGEKNAAEIPDAHTIASGLRVPKAIGDFLILKILRESKGARLLSMTKK